MKSLLIVILVLTSSLSMAQNNSKKKVKVKKSKDGSSIYNFNFYNNKDKKAGDSENKKNEEKKEKIKDENLVVYKKKKLKKGNGLEGGIFTINHLGDMKNVSDLDLGLGLKIGLIMMNPDSGLYYTPGIFVIDASAKYDGTGNGFMIRDYDGSAFGGYLKVGKLIDRGSKFSIDAGVEASYMAGDLGGDDFFGIGNYKFNTANFSAYGGPVFKIENFQLSGLLNLGVSHVSVKEVVTYSNFYSLTTNYSDKKMIPFYGLSVNATFVF